MPKLRMWKDNKQNDYRFVDRTVKEFFYISGTKVLVHRYEGTYDAKGNPVDNVKIQDILFMETRDRRYSDEQIELMTIYEMSDNDFELSQFGFYQSDTLYIDFHLNDMVERIGRKLSNGDVIEVLHLRDDLLEGIEGAVNAFYVVEEGRRPVAGYHATWRSHMWRIRMSKISDSREYGDILGDRDDENSLSNILSNYGKYQEQAEAINEAAEKDVPYNGANLDYVYDERFDGAIVPPSDLDTDNIDSGIHFPMDAENGDYFIREDYRPHQLFQYNDGIWKIVDLQIKKWVGPHEYTDSFVNNTDENCIDGHSVKERTYITNPLGIQADDDDEEDT